MSPISKLGSCLQSDKHHSLQSIGPTAQICDLPGSLLEFAHGKFRCNSLDLQKQCNMLSLAKQDLPFYWFKYILSRTGRALSRDCPGKKSLSETLPTCSSNRISPTSAFSSSCCQRIWELDLSQKGTVTPMCTKKVNLEVATTVFV